MKPPHIQSAAAAIVNDAIVKQFGGKFNLTKFLIDLLSLILDSKPRESLFLELFLILTKNMFFSLLGVFSYGFLILILTLILIQDPSGAILCNMSVNKE